MSIADAWDGLDGAIQSILVAQPTQMTAAAERLELARLQMRQAIFSSLTRPAPVQP